MDDLSPRAIGSGAILGHTRVFSSTNDVFTVTQVRHEHRVPFSSPSINLDSAPPLDPLDLHPSFLCFLSLSSSTTNQRRRDFNLCSRNLDQMLLVPRNNPCSMGSALLPSSSHLPPQHDRVLYSLSLLSFCGSFPPARFLEENLKPS